VRLLQAAIRKLAQTYSALPIRPNEALPAFYFKIRDSRGRYTIYISGLSNSEASTMARSIVDQMNAATQAAKTPPPGVEEMRQTQTTVSVGAP